MLKYFDEADISVTICDKEGKIIEMNQQSRQVNCPDGRDLIGFNVLDCHPEPARSLLQKMMTEELKHVYTIDKKGKKSSSTRSPGTRTASTPASSSCR